MSKRILSVVLLILMSTLMLFGCKEEPEVVEPEKYIINNNVFKICVLLPEGENGNLVENGIKFANSLSDTINLSQKVDIAVSFTYYNSDSDIKASAQELVNDNASVIIFSGDEYKTFVEFTSYTDQCKIPVISLSPFTHTADNFYSVSVSPKYISSASSTYAMDKGYVNSAILLESSDKYYSDFAEVYKNTFNSYIGTSPTAYYAEGELANYSAPSLSAGNYDFVLIVCSVNNLKSRVEELRNAGYQGEIMLCEVINKSQFKDNIFDNCVFISKLEADSSNNVATIVSPMLAEANGINENEISAATAYGYDAYMLTLEALKSFAPSKTDSFISNTVASTEVNTKSPENITASEYTQALSGVSYVGLTGIITFDNNSAVSNYVYIDNIADFDIIFNKKYSFSTN